MALIFTDPNSAGPFPSFQIKDVVTKVIKLDFNNFKTTNVDALVACFPADASFVRFTTWLATAFAGNSVSSPVISLGNASAGTQFASAVAITNTLGTEAIVSPVAGILQPYNIPNTSDIDLWVRGGCSTGNPTSGVLYLIVEYVR